MKPEYEIKVLGIIKAKIQKKLESIGFKKVDDKFFQRYIYSIDDKSWVRLRTDGNKTTLTLKKFELDSIDGVKEIEINVDDLEKTNSLLENIGLKSTKYQENKRSVYESSEFPNAEIVIDEWPHIEAYMEIEAESEATVKTLMKKLDIENLDTTSAPTSEVYKRAGLDIDNYEKLTF